MNNCKYCKDDGDACARCGCRGKKAVLNKGPKGGWSWLGHHSVNESLTDTTVQTTGVSLAKANGCIHDGTKPLWTLSNGTVLYAARGGYLASDKAQVGHLDLILDLANLVGGRKPFVVDGPRRYRDLNRAAFPEVVKLNWPDMTAPVNVPLRFWQHLLRALKGLHVCVACMGSHGRTGTCLGALLIADGKGAGDGQRVIADVRETHCTRAIETPGQEAYLKSLATQGQQRGKV